MTFRRMLAALVAAVLLSTSLVLGGAGSATASKPKPKKPTIGLSWSGNKNWSKKLKGPFFKSKQVLVPGTFVKRGIFIRNLSKKQTRLTVKVKIKDPHGLLKKKWAVFRVKPAAKSKWVTFKGGKFTLPAKGAMKPNRERWMAFGVQIPRSAPNAAMRKSISWKVSVRLTEVRPKKKGSKGKRDAAPITLEISDEPEAPAASGDSRTPGALAATPVASDSRGLSTGLPLVALAALAGLGLAFSTRLRARARNSRTDEGAQA